MTQVFPGRYRMFSVWSIRSRVSSNVMISEISLKFKLIKFIVFLFLMNLISWFRLVKILFLKHWAYTSYNLQDLISTKIKSVHSIYVFIIINNLISIFRWIIVFFRTLTIPRFSSKNVDERFMSAKCRENILLSNCKQNWYKF